MKSGTRHIGGIFWMTVDREGAVGCGMQVPTTPPELRTNNVSMVNRYDHATLTGMVFGTYIPHITTPPTIHKSPRIMQDPNNLYEHAASRSTPSIRKIWHPGILEPP